MRLEWLLNLETGPVVGTRMCADLPAAKAALRDAIEAAFGSAYGPHHATGVAILQRSLTTEAPTALARSGEWAYKVAAMSITLSL